jgi:hypothetical protein
MRAIHPRNLVADWAGPSLLAMIMFEKFGQHQPLDRQAERYALEGVPVALSTMADAVGSVCAALDPLLRLVEAHVMAAARLHADDTTVPVLARGSSCLHARAGHPWHHRSDMCRNVSGSVGICQFLAGGSRNERFKIGGANGFESARNRYNRDIETPTCSDHSSILRDAQCGANGRQAH